MEKILVSAAGVFVIGFIYWFFFGKREKAVEATDKLTIIVDGGYKPNIIRLKKGRTTTLTFIRRDPNTCLEDFYIPDFKIKEYLPMNKPVEVPLTPPRSGTHGFHCGMNMYFGKIIVS